MVKNLNILFYLRRDKEDDKGMVPIYCRISVNGKRSELSLKRYVDPSKWISGKEQVSGTKEESKSINAHIASVRLNLYNHINDMERQNLPITPQSIKSAYLGIKEKSFSLVDVFTEHNEKVKSLVGQDFAHGTYERYETCLRHVKEFIKTKYQLNDFDLVDINNEFITEFDYFLRATKKCANNTTVKYIKNFKKIIRLSLANGWITKDPFVNYKVKLDKTDRGYLTEDELALISNKEISTPRLAQVRDEFLFQCYTGLAYADIKKLNRDHIVKGIDGNLWISIYRTKTKTHESVPLIPEALTILDKYKDCPEALNKGVLLPILSNQKMNAYLKEIADICGIAKRLSTHISRHTFATTITLANGVSIESVSKMLGHTNINTTKIYARMMDSRVAEEMEALRSRRSLKIVSNG